MKKKEPDKDTQRTLGEMAQQFIRYADLCGNTDDGIKTVVLVDSNDKQEREF